MSIPNPIIVPMEVSSDSETLALGTTVSEPTTYTSLANKPSINGTTVDGDKTGADFDLMTKGVDYVTAGQKSGTTLGTKATAEGHNNTVSGDVAHAEGQLNVASGNSAHAEGQRNTASADYSHAEGQRNTASATWSHAEGILSQATGQVAHAEGYNTTSSGTASHSEGYGTIANHQAQHVFGSHNIEDTFDSDPSAKGKYIEIVGNGTPSERSNARTLDWSGNEVLSGKLTLGADPTEDMDAATIAFVANRTGNPVDLSTQNKEDLVSAINEVNAIKYQKPEDGIPWSDFSSNAKGQIDKNKVFVMEYGGSYQSITHEISTALDDGKAVFCKVGTPSIQLLPLVRYDYPTGYALFSGSFIDYDDNDRLIFAYAVALDDNWDEFVRYDAIPLPLHPTPQVNQVLTYNGSSWIASSLTYGADEIDWTGGNLGQQTRPATVEAAIELLYTMITGG